MLISLSLAGEANHQGRQPGQGHTSPRGFLQGRRNDRVHIPRVLEERGSLKITEEQGLFLLAKAMIPGAPPQHSRAPTASPLCRTSSAPGHLPAPLGHLLHPRATLPARGLLTPAPAEPPLPQKRNKISIRRHQIPPKRRIKPPASY